MAVFDTPLFTSDQSIDRVLKTGLPVLLVFFTPPASPALDQSLKDVAKKEAGKLLVVQVNPKDSPETTRRFNVTGSPALVAYKNGSVAAQSENIRPADIEAYASFLLDRGPKPEPQRERQQAAQATGVGAANVQYRPQPGPSYSPGGNGGSSGGQPVTVTDASFDQEVMRSPVPVVVDFWAPWCGPCRMVAPTLDKLAREWAGKVKIAKVNVDENPGVASRFGVTGIPTMLVVKNGQVLDQWAGALPEGPLRQRLANSIK